MQQQVEGPVELQAVIDPAQGTLGAIGTGYCAAIDFHEGDKIDEKALKALIRAAMALALGRLATGNVLIGANVSGQ